MGVTFNRREGSFCFGLAGAFSVGSYGQFDPVKRGHFYAVFPAATTLLGR